MPDLNPLDSRNGWQIISPSKSFTVYAATATEKAEWMAHINKCVQDLLKKREYKIMFKLLFYSFLTNFANCSWTNWKLFEKL